MQKYEIEIRHAGEVAGDKYVAQQLEFQWAQLSQESFWTGDWTVVKQMLSAYFKPSYKVVTDAMQPQWEDIEKRAEKEFEKQVFTVRLSDRADQVFKWICDSVKCQWK